MVSISYYFSSISDSSFKVFGMVGFAEFEYNYVFIFQNSDFDDMGILFFCCCCWEMIG